MAMTTLLMPTAKASKPSAMHSRWTAAGSNARRSRAVAWTTGVPRRARKGRCDMLEPMMSSAAGTVMLPSMVSGWLTNCGTPLMPKATMSIAA